MALRSRVFIFGMKGSKEAEHSNKDAAHISFMVAIYTPVEPMLKNKSEQKKWNISGCLNRKRKKKKARAEKNGGYLKKNNEDHYSHEQTCIFRGLAMLKSAWSYGLLPSLFRAPTSAPARSSIPEISILFPRLNVWPFRAGESGSPTLEVAEWLRGQPRFQKFIKK